MVLFSDNVRQIKVVHNLLSRHYVEYQVAATWQTGGARIPWSWTRLQTPRVEPSAARYHHNRKWNVYQLRSEHLKKFGSSRLSMLDLHLISECLLDECEEFIRLFGRYCLAFAFRIALITRFLSDVLLLDKVEYFRRNSIGYS